jgi:hypothetical protein
MTVSIRTIMEDDLTLIFPPTHDLAMPYLAVPLLSSYIKAHTGLRCRAVDLNQQLFSEAVGAAFVQEQKAQINLAIHAGDLIRTYLSILELEKGCLERLHHFYALDHGYDASLRQIRVPFDTSNSAEIHRGINAPSNTLSRTLRALLQRDKYDTTKVFGISIGVEDQMFPAFLIARLLREEYPRASVVLGGNMTTRLADQIEKSCLAEYIDFLITNEGEAPFLALVRSQGSYPSNDPKIISLKRTDERPQTIGTPHDVEDVITPSFSQFSLSDYLAPEPFIPVLASRRCYWGKCDFCAIPNAWDPTFRQREAEDVIAEIAHYAATGTRFFRIVDEDFPPRLMRDCVNLILAKGLDIRFEAYSRFETDFLDPQFCHRLFAAGCRQLFFGLENIGPRTAALVNKGAFYTEGNIRQCLSNTAAAGILNYLFVLIGIPNAPIDEEEATASFIISNDDIHCMALGSFVVDRLSPIEVSSEVRSKYDIELFEIGDMTTEVGYTYKGRDVRAESRRRAASYTESIFSARPDLAVTALLDEETRCVMVDSFGNRFGARLAAELPSPQLRSILKLAMERCEAEKIERALTP